MNSNASCAPGDTGASPTGPTQKIVLEIRGQTIPNFKNMKRWITRLPNGKPLARPFLITDPKAQEIMKRITNDFESQLLSAFRTIAGGTLTEATKRLLTASCVPQDDSWDWIGKSIINAELCEPGQEGVTLIIQPM